MDNTGSNERNMPYMSESPAEHVSLPSGGASVTIRMQSFLNGYMTIRNVPYVVSDDRLQGRLTASTMLRLAHVTRFMQERGLSEFDLNQYNLLR